MLASCPRHASPALPLGQVRSKPKHWIDCRYCRAPACAVRVSSPSPSVIHLGFLIDPTVQFDVAFRSDPWKLPSGDYRPSASSPDWRGVHVAIPALQRQRLLLWSPGGQGCSASEPGWRMHPKNGIVGLWEGLLQTPQDSLRFSKCFGSPELITFPGLCLWGLSISKLITPPVDFKQRLSMDSVCFYFNPFLEALMLS